MTNNSTIDEIIRETFQDGSYITRYYHNDTLWKTEAYNNDGTLLVTEVISEDGNSELIIEPTPYKDVVESIKDPSVIIEVSMQDIAYIMGVPVKQLRIIHE